MVNFAQNQLSQEDIEKVFGGKMLFNKTASILIATLIGGNSLGTTFASSNQGKADKPNASARQKVAAVASSNQGKADKPNASVWQNPMAAIRNNKKKIVAFGLTGMMAASGVLFSKFFNRKCRIITEDVFFVSQWFTHLGGNDEDIDSYISKPKDYKSWSGSANCEFLDNLKTIDKDVPRSSYFEEESNLRIDSVSLSSMLSNILKSTAFEFGYYQGMGQLAVTILIGLLKNECSRDQTTLQRLEAKAFFIYKKVMAKYHMVYSEFCGQETFDRALKDLENACPISQRIRQSLALPINKSLACELSWFSLPFSCFAYYLTLQCTLELWNNIIFNLHNINSNELIIIVKNLTSGLITETYNNNPRLLNSSDVERHQNAILEFAKIMSNKTFNHLLTNAFTKV
jgi:hypothetical protein